MVGEIHNPLWRLALRQHFHRIVASSMRDGGHDPPSVVVRHQ
jgi:hypothetical protein